VTDEHETATQLVRLRIEFDDEPLTTEQLAELERRLGELDDVAAADAVALEPRDPMTVLAAIGVAVAVVKTSTELVVQLRRLLSEVTGLVDDIKTARRVVVEADDGDIEFDPDASEDDLARVAASVE
jgi:hypothetical protein